MILVDFILFMIAGMAFSYIILSFSKIEHELYVMKIDFKILEEYVLKNISLHEGAIEKLRDCVYKRDSNFSHDDSINSYMNEPTRSQTAQKIKDEIERMSKL